MVTVNFGFVRESPLINFGTQQKLSSLLIKQIGVAELKYEFIFLFDLVTIIP